MHKSSMDNMQGFRDKYLVGQAGLTVLDVGSQDINGSYRELFKEHNYIGLDIIPGKNVDITDWNEIENDSFDVIISGQTFEHIENDQEVMNAIAMALKEGSYCCIIAPSMGEEHCKTDYRRYQSEDFNFLARQAGLKVIESKVDHSNNIWGDCILIARKVNSEEIEDVHVKVEHAGLKKLNLGCGPNKLAGYINLDIRAEIKPDIVCNVEEGLPYDDNTFDEVRAWDFLEHCVQDKRIFVIEEIYRVLKHGGVLNHFTPSTDGRGWACDPTHYSAWNIVSWRYYTDDAHRNLYGIKAKFEVIELRDVVANAKLNIIHTLGKLKAIK